MQPTPRLADDSPDDGPDERKVADHVRGHWVHRALPLWAWPYAQLARWERPIGWWLLLWPCWWSLALATGVDAHPSGVPANGREFGPVLDGFRPLFFCNLVGYGVACKTLSFIATALLFMLGAIAMRGAGCTWNDLADHRLDASVARTASRPLPSGRVGRRGAVIFLGLQLLVGFAVLVALSAPPGGLAVNGFAFLLGVSSLGIVALYPFAKRVTDWPQVVLGLAFSWGALMGWAVLFGEVALPALTLYAAAIAWTVGYDTIYAHQDREDDALIGVRSTARLFGKATKPALLVLYGLALALMALAFAQAGTAWPAYAGLLAGAVHMGWQIVALDIDDAENCLRLFRSNTVFGWLVFAGLLAAALV